MGGQGLPRSIFVPVCFLLPLQVVRFADNLVVYRNQFMREVASTSEVSPSIIARQLFCDLSRRGTVTPKGSET